MQTHAINTLHITHKTAYQNQQRKLRPQSLLAALAEIKAFSVAQMKLNFNLA